MAELNLDQSELIIELDKPYLYFNLDASREPDNQGCYGKSECTIIVKNKSKSYAAVRTKTTKKEVYAVNPTYGIVPPNGTLEIKFIYHIKDLNEDPKKHKFKFEGVAVDTNVPDKDLKSLFDQFISNKTRVKGNAIKSEVVFNFMNKNTRESIQNVQIATNLAKIQNSTNNNVDVNEFTSSVNPFKEDEKVLLVKSSHFNAHNNQNVPPNFKPVINDKESEEVLQSLKMDYQKYKNTLANLIETYKSLKIRVEMEKSKEIQTNVNITLSTSEEKQISKKMTLILFVLSIILGFFLAR